ncbi:MAG: hypothetical protein LBB34_00605 [Holosporales bacterium]|jgi:hypothetical protein|nr:hypothetical protein [Holosporales bacterium]
MKKIIAKLRETMTLLVYNEDTSQTTGNMYSEIVNIRGSARLLGVDEDFKEIFEVIILKPPAKFQNVAFTALKWNGQYYRYNSKLREYKGDFLKCSIVKL